jgi:nicotinate-nucleotide pyrophosphorylase
MRETITLKYWPSPAGIDLISIGWLTHDASIPDIHHQLVREPNGM